MDDNILKLKLSLEEKTPTLLLGIVVQLSRQKSKVFIMN